MFRASICPSAPEDGHIDARKNVEIIYDNKTQLLHQIGISRHFHT
jgi:hypothetical protein